MLFLVNKQLNCNTISCPNSSQFGNILPVISSQTSVSTNIFNEIHQSAIESVLRISKFRAVYGKLQMLLVCTGIPRDGLQHYTLLSIVQHSPALFCVQIQHSTVFLRFLFIFKHYDIYIFVIQKHVLILLFPIFLVKSLRPTIVPFICVRFSRLSKKNDFKTRLPQLFAILFSFVFYFFRIIYNI